MQMRFILKGTVKEPPMDPLWQRDRRKSCIIVVRNRSRDLRISSLRTLLFCKIIRKRTTSEKCLSAHCRISALIVFDRFASACKSADQASSTALKRPQPSFFQAKLEPKEKPTDNRSPGGGTYSLSPYVFNFVWTFPKSVATSCRSTTHARLSVCL